MQKIQKRIALWNWETCGSAEQSGRTCDLSTFHEQLVRSTRPSGVMVATPSRVMLAPANPEKRN